MKYLLYNNTLYPNTHPIISAYDRGFAFGDGVFETFKVTNQHPELWASHLERMAYGCSILNIKMPDNLDDMALRLIKKNNIADGILKITLSRESPLRGLGIHNDSQINILITTSELPIMPSNIRAMISDIRRNEGSVLSQIKSLNYADNLLALKQAHELGYDDALMLNNQNQPCCFTTGNIVIETTGGKLLTPPPKTGCLKGTFTQSLKHIHIQNFTLDEAVKIWRANCISGLVTVAIF